MNNKLTAQQAMDILYALPQVKYHEKDLFKLRCFIADQAQETERLHEVLTQLTGEETLYQNGEYQTEMSRLHKKNIQLKNALEFYANEKTYRLGVKFSMGSAHPHHEPIKYDKGEKARQAIEGSQ